MEEKWKGEGEKDIGGGRRRAIDRPRGEEEVRKGREGKEAEEDPNQ